MLGRVRRPQILSVGFGVAAVASTAVSYLRMEATTLQRVVFVRPDQSVIPPPVESEPWFWRYELWGAVAIALLAVALCAAVLSTSRQRHGSTGGRKLAPLMIGALVYLGATLSAFWYSSAYEPPVGLGIIALAALCLASGWRKALTPTA